MKALVNEIWGDEETLTLKEIPVPQLQDGEVLVKIQAIGINPVDYKTREGALAGMFNLPFIIGWDLAGIIEKKGPGVADFKEGDAVFGMVNFPGQGAAYAEYATVPAHHLTKKPAAVTFEEAAAVPLAGLTAWQAFTQLARIQPGQRVLIHAAAGGVGHLAVQIAKSFGAVVAGTASASNEQYLRDLGVDEFINYREQDFRQIDKADLVLDAIGGQTAIHSLEVTKPGGMVICLPSTEIPANYEEDGKRLGVQADSIMVQSDNGGMKELARLMEEGRLKVSVSHVFRFNEMDKAHQQQASGHTRGKIVVKL